MLALGKTQGTALLIFQVVCCQYSMKDVYGYEIVNNSRKKDCSHCTAYTVKFVLYKCKTDKVYMRYKI